MYCIESVSESLQSTSSLRCQQGIETSGIESCHFAQEAHGGKAASALDAHAQRLGLVAADSVAAVHPLEAALDELKYEDKQLEAPEPQLPQVMPNHFWNGSFVEFSHHFTSCEHLSCS